MINHHFGMIWLVFRLWLHAPRLLGLCSSHERAMPIIPCDVQLQQIVEDLLTGYDINEAKGCLGLTPRTTILVSINKVCLFEDHLILQAQQYAPEGLGPRAIWDVVYALPEDKIVRQVQISWDVMKPLPPMHMKLWMRQVEDLGSFPLDFTYDTHAFVVPLPEKRPSPEIIHHLEMFSGGFAGWTAAAQLIEKISPARCQSVGLEIDPHVARTSALTHHACFTIPCHMLPTDLISKFDGTWIICADVCDQSWLPCIAQWNVDLISMSFPCQPWSGAAAGPGFHDPNAKILLHAVLQTRWIRPTCIALENVPGFYRHPHKKVLAKVLLLAGYKIVWEKCADIQDCLGVIRPRWLALAVRVNANLESLLMPWPSVPRTWSHRDSVIDGLPAVDHLVISESALTLASDIQFCSWKDMKKCPTPAEVLATRTNGPNDILPTFMAMYGSQHNLDPAFLRRHGFFAHFKAEDSSWPGKARYWDPAEILLIHGIPEAAFVDADPTFSWKVAGNLISVPQAAMVLIPAFEFIGPHKIDASHFMQEFLVRKLKAATMTVTKVPRGIFLNQPDSCPTQVFLDSVEALFDLQHDGDLWLPTAGRVYYVPGKDLQSISNPAIAIPCRVQDVVEVESSLEATLPFQVIQTACIDFQGSHQVFGFDSNLSFSCFEQYWYQYYGACHVQDETPAFSVRLKPVTEVESRSNPLPNVTVPTMHDQKLTFIQADPEVALCQHAFYETLPDDMFDLFGPIQKMHKATDMLLLTSVRIQHNPFPGDLLQLFSTFAKVAMDFRWDHASDHVILSLQGISEHIQIVADFWTQALDLHSLAHLGRQTTLVHTAVGFEVHFAPCRSHAVCPPKLFKYALAIAAFRSMMDCIPTHDHPATLISIKWHGRALWHGELPCNLNVGILLQFLVWTLHPVHHGAPSRLVHKGRQMTMDATLADTPMLDLTAVSRLHVILAMRGGAGNSTKNQQRIYQQSALAAILLEHGFELPWISATVELILNKTSLAKIQHVTSQPPGTTRIHTVLQLCREMNVEIPAVTKTVSRKPHDGLPWKPKKAKSDDRLNPLDYQILPDFFKNQDDSSVRQLTSFQPQSNGLCLMLADQALPYLSGEQLSPDELGIVVLAQTPPNSSMTATKVVFPCWNPDQQMVLLTGFLYQFGARDIKIQQGDPHQVKAESCSLVALTMHRAEWGQEDWATLATKPIPFLRMIFDKAGLEHMVLSIWGKSLRCGKAPASPAQAESVQVHCSITTAKLNKFLSKSGFNSIYATPKLSSGRLDQSYKIIWISKDEAAPAVLAMKAPNCMGLVKGKSSMGLRFLEQDFGKAWDVLHPGIDKPVTIEGDLVFKAEGLPFGTTADMIKEWAGKTGWICAPIRALGPSAWLLRAASQPPQGLVMFNASPILIRYLPPKALPSSPVVLGPKASKTTPDPLTLQDDPWASWKGPRPTASTPGRPMDAPARSLDGPIATRLQHQDDKIQQLQASLDQVTALQTASNAEVSQRFEKIEKTQQANMQTVTGAIDSVRSEIDKSLQQVMQHNTKLLDSRLNDLKQLLQQANKRPLEPGQEDMQDWRCPSLLQLLCWPWRAPYDDDVKPCLITLDFASSLFVLFSVLCVAMQIQVLPVLLFAAFVCAVRAVMLEGDTNLPFLAYGLPTTRDRIMQRHAGPSVCGWFFSLLHSLCCVPCLPRPSRSAMSFWFIIVFLLESPSFACHSFDPHLGQRVGEASVPGPRSDLCRIAITNPTSIVSKAATYHELIHTHKLDVITASETAATHPAQKLFSFNMRQVGFRSQWSAPVPEKFARSDGQPSLRGQALGVANFSWHPIRTIPGTIDESDLAMNRIMHTLVDFHGFQLQLITLYGFAASGTNPINRALVQSAIKAATQLPLPYIILGDFNANPWKLGLSDELNSLFLRDLPQLYPDLHQDAMPPTCRQVTLPDNALLSPELHPFVRSIQVCHEPYFDCHQVVIFALDLTTAKTSQLRLPMPAPWNDLAIDFKHVELGYQMAVKSLGQPADLESWGQTVEFAVDFAYRTTQCDNQHISWDQSKPLPKKFRGRCQPRQVKAKPKILLTQPGRPGDFHPGEVCRKKTQAKIRQVRRVQCLLTRLQKLQDTLMSPEQFHVVWTEWQAILRARCMDVDFVTWCQHVPELGPPPMGLPAIDYLCTLVQLLKHDATIAQADDKKFLDAMRTYRHHLDAKWAGHSQAFTRMRDGFITPLDRITEHLHRDALVAPNDDQTFQVWCDSPLDFSTTQPVQLDDFWYSISSKSNHGLVVKPLDRSTVPPAEAVLTQSVEIQHPDQIFARLHDFWAPYWERQEEDPVMDQMFQDFLDRLPHDLPPPAFNVDDSQLWLNAVRSMKTRSARGVDGISSWELKQLPAQAILDVGTILNGYHGGFPDWFMMALTTPVPKVPDVPTVAQLRPITILAQLYRLWSRVICQNLLRHFSRFLPPDLTGLLVGRGPLDASMRQQFLIEQSHASRQPLAGLCLDLIKCYNTVHRSRVKRLLLACAIPEVLVDQWFSSLQRMTRIWIYQGVCSSPTATHTGVPEGDSWSVICMIMLDLLWVIAVRTESINSFLSAYADNISWAADTAHDHEHIIRATLNFVQCTGMSIDWTKTWIWSVSKQALDLLQQPLNTLVPQTKLVTKRTAMDLGTQMTYAGPPLLGKVRDRLAKAHARLSRLRTMQMPLPSKVTLLLGGVYPVAFYGVAALPLGSTHVDSLRKACADGLFGFSHSRNSALAVIATPRMLDPLEYIIGTVIRTIKRFVLQLSEPEVAAFFRLASRADGLSNHCRGPASVLKFWLQKLGWQIDPVGMVDVHVAFRLSIRSSSATTWMKWIRRAWQQEATAMHCNRAALKFLNFDFATTRRVIASFPVKQQPALVQELAGAFQVESQKAHWASDSDGKCLHCGEHDSREHRLFFCPATQDVRQPFAPMLQHLREEGLMLHELPAIPLNPTEELLSAVHYCHPEADVTPAALGRIMDLFQWNCTPVIFTDGSLQLSCDATSRFAAYALVWDSCLNDAHRRDIALDWQLHGQVPSNFVPLAFARTTGEQTVHRSELYAIVRSTELLPSAHIISDSASALAVAYQCGEARSLAPLASLQDFDLVERLWKRLQTGSYSFSKVKSHVKPSRTQTPLECFQAWGNQHADATAIAACWNLSPDVVAQALSLHEDTKTQVKVLRQLFELHLKLHASRAQLDQARTHQGVRPDVVSERRVTPVQLYVAWTLQDLWICQPNHINQTNACAWGPTLSAMMLQWMRKIQWPANLDPHQDDPGISMHELCVSFILDSRCLVPVKRSVSPGKDILVPADSMSHANALQITFAEVVYAFCTWIHQMVKLVGFVVWPSPHGTVRSLYRLGSSQQHTGYKLRPCIPFQEQTVRIMYDYVRSNSDFQQLPDFPLSPVSDAVRRELDCGWALGTKRAGAAIRLVKKLQVERSRPLSFGTGWWRLMPFRWRFFRFLGSVSHEIAHGST